MVYFLIVLLAIFFGVVEGITEWLPISSTGHMMLITESFSLFGFDMCEALGFNHGQDFVNLFLVVVQLGAILAVVVYFFRKLWPFGGFRNEEATLSKEEAFLKEKDRRKKVWVRWGKTLLGVLPALVVGLLFELTGWGDALSNWITIGITLIVYGVLFILVEALFQKGKFEPKYKSIDELPWKIAFFIGCFQVLALLPGTSRSGVTIIGGLLLLSSRETAAEYSFYLSIPVMFGASLLKLVNFFVKNGNLVLNEWLFLSIGMVTAFVISLLVVRWLMAFLKKHTFKGFGYYRIALGTVILLLFGILSVL